MHGSRIRRSGTILARNPSMMYVKKDDLPKSLQDVFPSTTNNMTKQEDDKRQ